MYNTKRIIRELRPYRSTAEIFQILGEERDSVFLDSSLVNDLGRYSIIGRNPYLKLLKRWRQVFITNIEETEITFEEYLRKYLQNHKDENQTDLPLVSGAVGYFSYEYGRKLMEIASGEKDIVSIPDAVLIFMTCILLKTVKKKGSFLLPMGQKHLLKSFCKRPKRRSRQEIKKNFPMLIAKIQVLI